MLVVLGYKVDGVVKDDRHRTLLRFLPHVFQEGCQFFDLYWVTYFFSPRKALDHYGLVIQQFPTVLIVAWDMIESRG
jgi:hypothetical protein